MAIESTISELTPQQVTDVELELVAMLQDVYPNLDLERGQVLRDLVLRPAAIVYALTNLTVDKARRSMSLSEIEADPTLADTDTVDAVLSNFLMTRQAATVTTGLLTIVVEGLITTSILANTTFTDMNGNVFIVTDTYTGVTSQSLVISTTDRLLRARSDGRYAFTIPIVAQTAGYIAVQRDTRFTLSPQIARLYDAYAESDFTPGRDEQSNAQLVNELKNGITAKSMGGRQQVDALIRAQFPSTTDISQIGNGDVEMARDRHNVFGISHGGKADLYVRSAVFPQTVNIEKSAVLVDAALQTWQVTLTRFDFPGFYDVVSIVQKGQEGITLGSLEIASEVRGVDLTSYDSSEFTPSIPSSQEGVYSAYQTATIIFTDPNRSTAGLTEGQSTADYVLAVRGMQDIGDIQSHVGHRTRAYPTGDYLVKAPIPCLVNVEVVVEIRPGVTINQSAAKTAIVNIINSLTFDDGRLPVSLIADAIQELLPAGATIRLPIHVSGNIRQANSVWTSVSATDVLEVPDDPTLYQSSRTVSFFCTEDYVAITENTIQVADA